jgi:membrane-associated phospholipid phosphatase
VFGTEDAVLYEPFLQSRTPPMRWNGPILFDSAVREWLRGRTESARSAAGTTSWVLFGAVVAYPVIDVGVAWLRFGRAAAWDLFWQDSTAIALATAFDLNVRDAFGRARPAVSACLAAGGSDAACLGTGGEGTRSFPGGHVLIVTTAAALTCTQHLAMHLYGGAWDTVACVSAVTADVTVGVLRIVSDDHYATDILAGEALGLAFGWGIPVLMHLHGHAPTVPVMGTDFLVAPIPVPSGGGIGVTAAF